MEKLITTIPFDGFYESWSSERIDEAAGLSESDYEWWSQESPQGEKETPEEYRARRDAHFDALRDSTDFTALQNEYCKAYVEAFAKDNGIALEFEKLESPRFYNFTTDRIFAYITPQEAQRILSLVPREKLAEHIKENFTSRSGFDSHYSEYIDDWTLQDVTSLDHNEIGTIIEAYTKEHIAEEDEKYPYVLTLMEDFYR